MEEPAERVVDLFTRPRVEAGVVHLDCGAFGDDCSTAVRLQNLGPSLVNRPGSVELELRLLAVLPGRCNPVQAGRRLDFGGGCGRAWRADAGRPESRELERGGSWIVGRRGHEKQQ